MNGLRYSDANASGGEVVGDTNALGARLRSRWERGLTGLGMGTLFPLIILPSAARLPEMQAFQSRQGDPLTISVSVDTAVLQATVRNRSGAPVSGLEKGAFRFTRRVSGNRLNHLATKTSRSPSAWWSTAAGANLLSRDVFGSAPRADLPVGRIEISAIGLMAMIQEGTDARTLRHAVGHIPGTPLQGRQGNVALTGPRATFFQRLKDFREDDEIWPTTLKGSY